MPASFEELEPYPSVMFTFFLFTSAGLVTFANCLSQNDWTRRDMIHPSFFRLNTSNVLRCGKLCERQSACAAVSYDTRERICYLHGEDMVKVSTKSGRYQYSRAVGRMKKMDMQKLCSSRQLYLPDVGGGGRCKDIEYCMYMGCYRDEPRDRDLQSLEWNKLETNSKDLCISRCSGKGFKYAALQYSLECWCGDTYGKHGQIDEEKCNMACSGNSDEKCGGLLAQSIYATDQCYLQ